MNNREFEIEINRTSCKKLSVIQFPKGISGGLKKTNFFIPPGRIKIAIEQHGFRKITITAKKELTVKHFIDIFQTLEKLFMVFEGSFFPRSEFQFLQSHSSSPDKLQELSIELNRYRLSYYNSVEFLEPNNKLIDIFEIDIEKLFSSWEKLLSELDIIHQIILYSLANNGLTADLRCAFLIESAEPLVELVKVHKNYFKSLTPGERGTTLKMCLDAIITKYGDDIFSEERNCNYDNMLSILVNSRNRVMHIKRKQSKPILSGRESILYAEKLFCLYRRILFELLEIDYSVYQNNLKSLVLNLEKLKS